MTDARVAELFEMVAEVASSSSMPDQEKLIEVNRLAGRVAERLVASPAVFLDGTNVTPGTEGCVCGPNCEFPCWQRLGLTSSPCCSGCAPLAALCPRCGDPGHMGGDGRLWCRNVGCSLVFPFGDAA